MPKYIWRSESTGAEVEVDREFKYYETPPREDEVPEGDEGPWTRVIAGGTTVTKNRRWGKGKGHW